MTTENKFDQENEVQRVEFIKQIKNPTHVKTQDEPVKYPTIRRMLNTLDRFLAKKLVLVFGILSIGIVLCSGGLIVSAATVSAGSGYGTGSPATLDVVLFSFMAVFAFIGILTLVYFLSRHKHIKKHAN